MAIDFPTSDQSPFTAPNGVVYVWNANGYWGIASGSNAPDLQAVTTVGSVTTTGATFGNAVKNNDVASIPDSTGDDLWDLYASNHWTTAGANVGNPENVVAGQSGVIYCPSAVTSWGSKFAWSGGSAPNVPDNSVVPYFVAEADVISMGTPTTGIA